MGKLSLPCCPTLALRTTSALRSPEESSREEKVYDCHAGGPGAQLGRHHLGARSQACCVRAQLFCSYHTRPAYACRPGGKDQIHKPDGTVCRHVFRSSFHIAVPGRARKLRAGTVGRCVRDHLPGQRQSAESCPEPLPGAWQKWLPDLPMHSIRSPRRRGGHLSVYCTTLNAGVF